MQKSTTAVSHRSPLIALVKERYISNNEKVSFASVSVLTDLVGANVARTVIVENVENSGNDRFFVSLSFSLSVLIYS